MANLKDWVLDAAQGEPIEAVVIGRTGWASLFDDDKENDYNNEGIPDYVNRPHGKVLTWDVAAPLLDYEFDSGYGAPGCEAIYAWTATRIIAIYQYDGATGPFTVPRNPIECNPMMPGGG